MEYTVDGGFKCDIPSKEEFIISTTNYWKEEAPQLKLEWYGIDSVKNIYGEVIDFKIVDLGTESDKANIDLAMTATSEKTGKTYWYVYELKERWNKYTSTYYGEEVKDGCAWTYHNEGWVYNPEKDSVLQLAIQKGYRAVYVNLYPDNVIRTWTMNFISPDDFGEVDKNIKKHNVVADSPRVLQHRYTLMNNQGKTYERWRIN